MAKVTTLTIRSRSLDGPIFIMVPVSVNSKGIFTGTISKTESLKLTKYDPQIPEDGREYSFTAVSLDGLEIKLNKHLNDLVSCECIEEKEVIRYQIETACSYCEGDKEDNFEIYPNGSYMPDRLHKEETFSCSRWKGGTEDIYAQRPSPYYTKIYCKVYRKRTYAYRSGREVTQYEYAPDKRSGYNENDYVEWLKNICAISPISNYNMKEVDATQENAAVFVQLIKFICKANRLITELADSDKLIAYAGYLNDGPLQLEFFNEDIRHGKG